MPKTKIIATLGPASSSATVIRKMMLEGMDVVRLNFSHGSHEGHKAKLDIVRILNKKYRRRIKVLQDLQGNRIRIGLLKDHKPMELKKRQIIRLTQEGVIGEEKIIPFDYRGPLSDIKAGQFIYIDDGNIALVVKEKTKRTLKAWVMTGGFLKENKGVNIPGAHLSFPAITEEDKTDIQFGIENKVNYIAQSFVRSRIDVLAVKERISKELPGCLIIAKIECRQGIKNIDEIIEVSDGVMIARGDMGISVPIYEVPIIQKQIIKKCNLAKKFVITATQMLESMTENLIPTRAEVSDVANAIIDGTDFVMLSAESAVGKYPVETVAMMNNIIKFTERHLSR
ncbi:MAG: pyruvate kinase [Candidatus Omnitrophica bacterium]|nr:pyruvate kinase [Candidatus Omnitrophota bacterium]MBU1809511.1 pyruvate kinase [Candidatus Omnitrophota bacterium]